MMKLHRTFKLPSFIRQVARHCTPRHIGILLFFNLCLPAIAQKLTPLEERGQHIYRTGTLPGGALIPTFLGNSTQTIPSRLFACTNCHGPDGKGVPEGGVKPSNVTWHGLTKPYGAISGTHRDRPPYQEKQILTAIHKGVDPLGNPLEASMPRYHLAKKDGEAIIAYLKILHRIDDPGVSPHALRIGLIFPEHSKHEAMYHSLNNYFDEINKDGGIYRRKIELVTLRLTGKSETWFPQWKQFLDKEPLFALLTPIIDSSNSKELESLCQKHKLPVISPITATPNIDELPNPFIFYFYPGLKTQIRTLNQFSKKKKIKAQLIEKTNSEQLKTLKNSGTNALILSKPVLPNLLPLLEKKNWHPTLLLPEAFQIPALSTYPGEVYFSSPHRSKLPSDSQEALSSTALIAARLLHHQLLDIGRKTTRKKLMNKMEALHNHPTAWTGPLSFHPNRRLGAIGAYIFQKSEPNESPKWVTSP